jgi:predicted nucleic acid-binding protein
MLLVCNASPLIFLAKIDLIDVLPQITENLTIPVGVYQEIKGQNDAACKWVEKHKNKYVIEIDTTPKIIESWDLGKGETEVITHAYSRKDLKAALDDKAARNCAASLGIGVIGTIGLILVANKKGHIEKPVAYLEKLKETGFRIGDDLFEHAIRLAGK